MVSRQTPAPAGTPGSPTGRLLAHEVAEAAVLADVSVALCVLGWFLPFGQLLTVLSIVPMAVLGARQRTRAVIAGGVAGALVSLLLGGTGLAGNLVSCAVVGVVVGAAIRRSWGRLRTVGVAVVGLWPIVAGGAVGALALFAGVRRLALQQVLIQWHGASRILRHLGFAGVALAGDRAVPWLVVHWPVPLAAGLLGAITVSVWLTHRLAVPVVDYMERVVPPRTAPGFADRRDRAVPTPAPPAPVPVELREVTFRYPGSDRDAVSRLSARLDPGELVTVVGPNGSGKSTLVRVLAGAAPTGGEVWRPGEPGLGRPGGTALVFQHPERQVLGVRVRDDVVWGLPPDSAVDVPGVLARVGLEGMEDRETSTLSGGELQRLALAGALARRPALLLSDESTAMIDPEGRRQITDLLAAAARGGTTVVHVTHRPEEAARADRRLVIGAGAVAPTTAPRARVAGGGSIRLQGVGHVYARGTPWEHRALEGVDLTVAPGDGLLVVGRNGSGKSTLAWILAGLVVPTAGSATLDGRPLDRCVGRVGLAFQHARLQLLRSVLRDDVRSAAGVDHARADAALALVGLDPARFGHRRVDELSGGEQRRAALAGVLASSPSVLVLDEPFAGMDAGGRAELVDVLARLRAETGTSLVVVSHDTEGTDRLVDRVVTLEQGRVAHVAAVGAYREPNGAPPERAPRGTTVAAARPGPGATARTTVPPDREPAAPGWASGDPAPERSAGRQDPPSRHRRAQRELHLFRPVPVDSPVHRLWAGTKLLGLLAVAVTLSASATWWSIAAMTALVVAGLVAGRVPFGARPRLPAWFWGGIAVTAVLPLLAGGSPVVHVGGLAIGLGGVARWARLISLALVILLAAALVSWTTPLGGVAPAFRRLVAVGRRVRLPVDEWATTLGLSLRCIPLLLDEIRVLAAVTRLRAPHQPQRDRLAAWSVLPGNLLVAALVVGVRRAGEMGTAIEARGGLWSGPGGCCARIADGDPGPGWRDVAAMAAVAAAVVTAVLA